MDGVSRGVYNGEIEINMSGLTKSNTYTIALEWYQKDEWLFNHSQFSTDGTGLEIRNLTTTIDFQNSTLSDFYMARDLS